MRTFIYSVLVICVALFCVFETTRAVSTKNRVTNIPGYTGPAVESYNGYLFVKPENDGHLFYWFTPVKTPDANAPLMVWLNGGTCFCFVLRVVYCETQPFSFLT